MRKRQTDTTESSHLTYLIKSRCTCHTQVESKYFSLATPVTARLMDSKQPPVVGCTAIGDHVTKAQQHSVRFQLSVSFFFFSLHLS